MFVYSGPLPQAGEGGLFHSISTSLFLFFTYSLSLNPFTTKFAASGEPYMMTENVFPTPGRLAGSFCIRVNFASHAFLKIHSCSSSPESFTLLTNDMTVTPICLIGPLAGHDVYRQSLHSSTQVSRLRKVTAQPTASGIRSSPVSSY